MGAHIAELSFLPTRSSAHGLNSALRADFSMLAGQEYGQRTATFVVNKAPTCHQHGKNRHPFGTQTVIPRFQNRTIVFTKVNTESYTVCTRHTFYHTETARHQPAMNAASTRFSHGRSRGTPLPDVCDYINLGAHIAELRKIRHELVSNMVKPGLRTNPVR